jgi:hypothetical protein
MAVVTYEAVVEDGQVRLPTEVRLPNHAKVYVVVPEETATALPAIWSPRLVRAEDAAAFRMAVSEEAPDARL